MALRQLAVSTANFGLRWQVSTAASMQLPACLGNVFARSFSSHTVEKGLKYAESHEWVKLDGDVATVGISDYAQSELGEVVYVELPEKDADVSAGSPFGVVESVKAASDIYSPVSGTVVDTNTSALTDEPGKVNTSPYTDGWLIKVKLSNKSELEKLLEAEAYKAKLPQDK